MNSIKRLTVENFQSHRRTVIDFAPAGQLTIIVGRSRSGKTAIIRALRWLLYNDPRGVAVPSKNAAPVEDEKSGYCRVGASFIRVMVEMESGHTVIRERTSTTNRYKIITQDEDKPQVFEGFGDGVPLEVQEITGVRPIKIGDLEVNLNLSEQLDGPFLGTKAVSAPARAKVLGKLAGTEEIDQASKILGTDLHRRNQDNKRLTGEVSGLDADIKAYDWLPGMAQKIEALEDIVEWVKAAQERRGKAFGLKNRLQGILSDVYYTNLILTKWRGLEQAEESLNGATGKQQDKKQLESLITRYWTAQKAVLDNAAIIARHKNLPVAEEALRQAQEKAVTVRQMRNLRTSYLAETEMIGRSQEVLSGLQGLDAAGELLRKLDVTRQRRKKLEGLNARYIAGNSAVIGTEQLVKKYAGVDIAGEILNSLQAGRERHARIVFLWQSYRQADLGIEKAKEQAVMWENRAAELDGAYHDLLVDAGVCPLCGQEIKSKIKEAV